MNVQRWEPREEKRWDTGADGSTTAHIYTEKGVVEVFTFPGDDRHRAFTNFRMWLHPHLYDRTIARHYGDRWLRRLAKEFAWSCSVMNGGRDPNIVRTFVGRDFR